MKNKKSPPKIVISYFKPNKDLIKKITVSRKSILTNICIDYARKGFFTNAKHLLGLDSERAVC